jgi:hypothetical protein
MRILQRLSALALATTVFACATAPPPAPPTSLPPPLPPALTPAPAAPGPAAPSAAEQRFLDCIRRRESRQDYDAISPNKLYYGAYQFTQRTWNGVARHAGRDDLVGLLPSKATPADQDAMALALLRWQGAEPWNGQCR